MLSFEQIKELLELVSEHGLEGLEVERSGFRLKVQGQKREVISVAAAAPVQLAGPAVSSYVPPPVVSTASAASADGASPAEEGLPEGAHVLHSPIVGTFYGSPDPESDPYAREGDRVSKGQVLCIIEAMKLMNEIESDVAGVVLEVYPKNEQPVEYGEPLFVIQPD